MADQFSPFVPKGLRERLLGDVPTLEELSPQIRVILSPPEGGILGITGIVPNIFGITEEEED